MVKELHQLKGAGDPLPGDPVGRASLDLLAPKDDAARLGGEKTRHQVEQGGLAGAVGADDRLDVPRATPKLTCSTAWRPPKARLTLSSASNMLFCCIIIC